MFTDEDLFTISITADSGNDAGSKGKRGTDQECQTDDLVYEDKETTTLQATESVEVQADDQSSGLSCAHDKTRSAHKGGD